MKTFIFFVVFLLYSSYLKAQNFSSLDSLPLNNKADYENAETQVLTCSNYLLTTSELPQTLPRIEAMKFILRWMSGTPDYTFDISDEIGKIIKKDKLLMGVYMASLCKAGLENKINNIQQLKLAATKIFLQYCENPANQVKQDKALKKLIAADKQGHLANALNNS